MKLLSYDRAKLKLELEELHTKQLKDPSNTWHCAPVYACIKTEVSEDLLSQKFRTAQQSDRIINHQNIAADLGLKNL